jgi:[ribosomal protein S5]-alanine N-acetyltransferase
MYPVLRSSARLQLSEMTTGDALPVQAVYGSPAVTEHLSFEARSPEQVTALVNNWTISARQEPRTEYALSIREADHGPLVGVLRLATDPHQQRAATVGFALRPDAWGKGLGTEALRLGLGLAFQDLGLHRVWAARAPLNTASEKTLLAAGFQHEGVIREHVHTRGAWRDSVVYGILESEWTADQ